MYQNTRRVIPLNWSLLVEETLRRRKAEKITQRKHAALANVSVPTMAAFERRETTLSLAKVFDILRVVGLLDEQTEGNKQDIFVKESLTSWHALSDALPENSPARFPYGCFRFDYCFEGDLKSVKTDAFKKILSMAVIPHSRWPLFLMSDQAEIISNKELIEYWVTPQKKPLNQALNDQTSQSEFWCASPSGRLFLMRGYQEDYAETFPAGSIFDMILPIWRMGEALLHAERLASFVQKDKPLSINFRAVYSGLNGRVLRAWANPFSNVLVEERAAQNDEAILTAIIPAKDISLKLTDHLYPLISSLYERFGVKELSKSFLETEVTRLLESVKKRT